MFFVILGTVLGLMHLYVWKRLIKDTTRGRARWVCTAALVAMLVWLIATLLLPRLLGWREPAGLAWPGYVWFGLVVYLFLALLALEPIRLVLRGWVKKRKPSSATGSEESAMNRRVFLARAAAVTAGAASVGLVGVGVASALGPPDITVLSLEV